MTNALRVEGLEKRYGSVQALKGVDLEVGEGELVGLLGPNGAGKSTLVKIAVGLVRASGGRAEVAGARAGSRAARAELGYLAELFRFPGWYSADEVLALHQHLAGSDGGVFTFGSARFKGSMGGVPLTRPVVGMVRYGNGYLMVASDGGVFNFSNRAFVGSLGGRPSSSPVVSIATPG